MTLYYRISVSQLNVILFNLLCIPPARARAHTHTHVRSHARTHMHTLPRAYLCIRYYNDESHRIYAYVHARKACSHGSPEGCVLTVCNMQFPAASSRDETCSIFFRCDTEEKTLMGRSHTILKQYGLTLTKAIFNDVFKINNTSIT